ncbi:hypothetical protein AUL40_02200 [Yersinia pestis]|nr:hypothetical protein AUL40_02200 [Yersinia pestis]
MGRWWRYKWITFHPSLTLKGEAVPLGTYQDKKYFWESGEIVQGKTGPTLIIPAFVINRDNVQDPRHWAAVAEKTWGIPYT